MSDKEKDKKTPTEGINSVNEGSVHDAPSGDVAPEVEPAKDTNYTVKSGVEMVQIESPGGGTSGPGVAGRMAVGGGAREPSSDYSRTPDNRDVRGSGANPLEKIDIRKEEDWNEVGSAQLQTIVDAQPAGFEPVQVKGNFAVQSNHTFQTDNKRTGVGRLNRPSRVRAATIGRSAILFARGQNDGLQDAVVRYPTVSTGQDGKEVSFSSKPMKRGNFLLRGMTVEVKDKKIKDVSFSVEDLSSTSTEREDLDTRPDHARIAWEIANRKVTRDFFELINKKENLEANKYSPLADGFPQAIEHMLLATDIAAMDGVLATLGFKAYAEAYALHRALRGVYGSGEGALNQARRAFIGNTGYLHDNEVFAITPTTRNVPTATGFVTNYLDSPTKYRDTIGGWFVQPRGVLRPLQDAMSKFDSADFVIDTDSLKVIQTMFGWDDDSGVLVGHSDFGVVIPFDPNTIFTFDEDSQQILGRASIVDFVVNGNLRQGTNVGSPLLQGIIQGIKELVLHKREGEYELFIPFEFSTDKFTYSNMFLMEGIARAWSFRDKFRGVFDRFEQQYGVNPFVDDITGPVTMAQAIEGSGFRGLGADPQFPPLSQANKLYMMTPESIDVAGAITDAGLLESTKGHVLVAFDQMGQRGSGKYQFGFPILNRGARLEAYDYLVDLGAEKFLKSRDPSIYRPAIKSSGAFSSRSEAIGEYDDSCPFFSGASAGARAGNAIKTTGVVTSATGGVNGYVRLNVGDVLKAPRLNGRLAPAPMDILKRFYDESDSTWKWKANLDTLILNVEGGSDALYLNPYLKIVQNPIESVCVSFICEGIYTANVMGASLWRMCAYASSGEWSDTKATELAENWGIYVDPSSDVTDMYYSLVKTDEVDLGYDSGLIVATWANNNLISTVRSPYNSMYKTLDKDGKTQESRADLALAAAFNLVGYQQVFWNEYALSVHNAKSEASGFIDDNEEERADNVIYE